jgi:hypothetical protein
MGGEVTAMRLLFIVLALPLLLFGLTAAKGVPDKERENLVGPVHSVSPRMTQYYDGEGEGKGTARQLDVVTYDSRGNESERTIYDDYGFLVGKLIVTRDADGIISGSILTDPKRKVLERQVYVYADGRLREIVHHDSEDAIGLREVSTYGDDGLLREVTYYEVNDVVGREVHGYDAHGRGSEVAYFLPDGSKAIAPIGPCLGAHRMTYQYDEKGRSARVVAYEPDGTLKKSWQYTYNTKGDMAEELNEDSYSHASWTYSYEYDSLGNWTRRIAIIKEQPKPQESASGELGRMEPPERRMIHNRKITYY